MLTADEKENITLTGPGASLVMRRQDYLKPPYKKAEWRHCLALLGCRNVTVQGLRNKLPMRVKLSGGKPIAALS